MGCVRIYQVVISETKSMWYGESEKMIKNVFDKSTSADLEKQTTCHVR
jgi:SpoVK/Ycf46/Vps4 family AAA+-type ATPase